MRLQTHPVFDEPEVRALAVEAMTATSRLFDHLLEHHPALIQVTAQNEAFMECARVYLCGAAAAHCGIDRAQQTNTNECIPISRACLAEHPVPQQMTADPTAPKYEPPIKPKPLSVPPTSQSTITGPSGPGGGSNSGGVTTAR